MTFGPSKGTVDLKGLLKVQVHIYYHNEIIHTKCGANEISLVFISVSVY